MINFYFIKKTHESDYKTYSLMDSFSPVFYKSLDLAINLCRLRLNKTLQQDNLKIIKLPLTNTLILW